MNQPQWLGPLVFATVTLMSTSTQAAPRASNDAEIAGCSQHRTQTQGGWGTKCRGGNPGCYRDANFDLIGPLMIGMNTGCSVTLSSSEAVEQFLPQGGRPRSLEGTCVYVDPIGRTEAGVLGGQVATLALNVGFDQADPAFSPSTIPLANMVIANSDSECEGMTVQQVLNAANCVLSGEPACGTTPGGVQIDAKVSNQCATLINEAFADGNTNTGDVCDPPTTNPPGGK